MNSPRSPSADAAEHAIEDDSSGPLSLIPRKRKTSQDESLGEQAAATSAQRAFIAKAAPHLFDRNGNSSNSSHSFSTTPASSSPESSAASHLSANYSRSPSVSAQPSPAPSEDEDASEHDNGPRSDNKSRHAIPRGFRGPPPKLHDPEEIAPAPALVPVPGSSLFNTLNYPYTRNGYNYVAAGPSTDQLPISVYRTLETEPRGVHWSWSDRSPFTHISQDASIVGTDRGFRCARANVPVREGTWYVELHILPPKQSDTQETKDGPHVRVGWGRREAGLNAPVGINGYSYGIRDTTGEKVFLSRTYSYGKSFGPNDVIGMYISLPKARKVQAKDPQDPARIQRKRIPIRYKGRLYFESMEYAISKEMDHLMDRSRKGEKLRAIQAGEESSVNTASGLLCLPQTEDSNAAAAKKRRKNAPGSGPTRAEAQSRSFRSLPTLGSDSQIGFFVNGEPQGVAFDNLLDFRPLRKQGQSAKQEKNPGVKPSSSSLGLSDEIGQDTSVITTSSSLASILKSRENHFDDGSAGYFPYVSLFGGAQVRIVSKPEEFQFPPPADVRGALEAADRARGRGKLVEDDQMQMTETTTPCKPLAERYDEYLQELWIHDQADEEKAKVANELLQARLDEEDDQDDEETLPSTEQKTVKATSSRKPKKRATPSSYQNSPRTVGKPLQNEHGPSSDKLQPTSDAGLEAQDEAVIEAGSQSAEVKENGTTLVKLENLEGLVAVPSPSYSKVEDEEKKSPKGEHPFEVPMEIDDDT